MTSLAVTLRLRFVKETKTLADAGTEGTEDAQRTGEPNLK
jgi:hypothetical protein